MFGGTYSKQVFLVWLDNSSLEFVSQRHSHPGASAVVKVFVCAELEAIGASTRGRRRIKHDGPPPGSIMQH